MDIVSLGFLFAIVLTGGVAAFLADWLGWRIGKRRASMFGMRPKHFARLVVTGAGALIPFLTILVLAGASEGVRVWIAEGRRAVAEVKEVSEELTAARDELAEVKGETAGLRRANETAKRELETQRRELSAQRTLLATQETRLAGQSTRIEAQVARIGGLTAQSRKLASQVRRSATTVRTLTAANRNVRLSLESTRKAFEAGQRSLTLLRGQTRAAQGDLVKARGDLVAIRKDANDVNKDSLRLQAENGKLEASIRDLTEQTNALEAQIKALEADREAAQEQTDQVRGTLATLRVEADRVEGLLASFRANFALTRTEPLTFRTGDELARSVIPAGSSVADARRAVETLLRSARLTAERRGARANPGANPPLAAADLVPISFEGRNLGAAEQIDRQAADVAGREGDTVLVARAGLNFFEGEPVALVLAAFPDPVVFRRGEVVAEGRLDSRRGDGAVYAQINEFLEGRVQERARAANMVPVRSNGNPSFGEVEPAQILDVIRTARAEERVYRLQAIAAGEIRAGDRLKIELRIR